MEHQPTTADILGLLARLEASLPGVTAAHIGVIRLQLYAELRNLTLTLERLQAYNGEA